MGRWGGGEILNSKCPKSAVLNTEYLCSLFSVAFSFGLLHSGILFCSLERRVGQYKSEEVEEIKTSFKFLLGGDPVEDLDGEKLGI